MGCGASHLYNPQDVILGCDLLGTATQWPQSRATLVSLHKAKAFRHDKVIDEHGRTLSWNAAVLDKPDLLTFLRKKKANLAQPDKNGVTPLMAACQAGTMSAVQLLLKKKKKAQKNCATQDAQGRTPLHHAAIGNKTDVMCLLISTGKANRSALTFTGLTPLMAACQVGAEHTAAYLIEQTRIGHWLSQDNEGKTALDHALAPVSVEMADLAGVLGRTARAQTTGKSAIVSRLRPKIWLAQVTLATKQNRFGVAEALWLKLEQPAEAVRMYIIAEQFDEALRCAQTHKLTDMVRTVRERHAIYAQDHHKFSQAEDLWVQLDRPQDAINMYTGALRFDMALRVAKEHGRPAMLIGIYEKQAQHAIAKSQWWQAEAIFVSKLRRPKAAVTMYLERNSFTAALRCAHEHYPVMVKRVQTAKYRWEEAKRKEAEKQAAEARRQAEEARRRAEEAARAPSSCASYSAPSCGGYSGGCFAGDSLVQMADGAEKRAQDLERGDKVHGGTVRCVVEMVCPSGQCSLVTLGRDGGLRITPTHPVFVNDKWQAPRDVAPAKIASIDKVYNFVLDDNAHEVTIAGLPAVTLGLNGLHDYYGTRKVVDDLELCRGWEKGLIRFELGTLSRRNRDAVTGRIGAKIVELEL